MLHNHVQEHIDLIAKHEQEFLARRTRTERIGDTVASFAGSLVYVALHIVVIAAWVAVNTLTIPTFATSIQPVFAALELSWPLRRFCWPASS